MKKFVKVIIAIVLVSSLSACNKWLDLKPQDGLVQQDFWKTKEHVASAVSGIYISLITPIHRNKQLVEYMFLHGELRADMVSLGAWAGLNEQEITTVNILSTNLYAEWAPFYKVINYCNNVIDNAPAVLNLDPTLKKEDLDAYIAEALAVRSYMYFYLARIWGDVPLKLNYTKSDSDNLQIKKSSQEEVLNQIAKDLLEAEQKARLTNGSIAADKGRFIKYSINALQADVYLWLNNYEKALEATEKIINSNKYSLVPRSDGWFTALYALGNSKEGVFELQFDEQQLNPFYFLFYQNSVYQANPDVYEKFYAINLSDPTDFDIRGDRASLNASNNLIYKYQGYNRELIKSFEDSYTHWFAYKYSDVLLMKAEALNELNRGAEALDIVYEIRERANALDMTDLRPDADDKTGIANFILDERAREFAFEGKRWFDILRNARRNNYERLDLILDMILNTAPLDKQQSMMNKIRDVGSHYFPIYYTELQTNKALVQNSFYGRN